MCSRKEQFEGQRIDLICFATVQRCTGIILIDSAKNTLVKRRRKEKHSVADIIHVQ